MSQSPYKSMVGENSSIDRYSPVIVEDLLSGGNEWRNIQDIIRLTFKALTDVVKIQGQTIREIEAALPTRASKSELQQSLQLKVNVSDLTPSLNSLSQQLSSKASYEDLSQLLNQYTLHSDLQYLLTQKADFQDLNLLKSEMQRSCEKTCVDYLANNDKMGSQMENFWKEQEGIRKMIEELQEVIETKANKQSVMNALHRKLNKNEFEEGINKKADVVEVQTMLNEFSMKILPQQQEKVMELLEQKAEMGELQSVSSQLFTKADKTDVEEMVKQTYQKINNDLEKKFSDNSARFDLLRGQLEGMHEQFSQQLNTQHSFDIQKLYNEIDRKISQEQVALNLNSLKNEVYQDLLSVKEEFSQRKNTVDKTFGKSLDDLKGQFEKINLQRKTDIEETAEFIKEYSLKMKKEFKEHFDALAQEYDKIRSEIGEIWSTKAQKVEFLELKKSVMTGSEQTQFEIKQMYERVKEQVDHKIGLKEVKGLLQGKADTGIIESLMRQKIGISEFEDIKKLSERLCRELEDKITKRDYIEDKEREKGYLENMERELQVKANIKDVCMLLDQKANIEDVNKGLVEIHKELDVKTNLGDLSNFMNEQALVNESLCTENIVARWTWKSGELKPGQTVPWEIQVLNTLPDNFLWEKDKPSILTVAPGLYQISFGFYAKKKPVIQLLLNGEPILSALNSESYVIHHSSGKIKDVRHPAGIVTGLTMIDFIVLPARARLCFTYNGESGAEGFFGIKRM